MSTTFEPPVSPTPSAPAPAPEDDGLPRWPWWSPFLAVAIGMVGAGIGISIVWLIAQLAGIETTGDDTPPGITITGTIVQDAAFVGATIGTVWFLAGRPTPRDFGLRPTRPLAAIGWMFVIFAGFVLVAAIWSSLLGIDEPDDLPNELGADKSTVALIGVAFLVCVIAPLAEELFFRGFLFTALRRAIGVVAGMVVTGILFGLVHLGGSKPEYLFPLAVLGAALCLLYWLTDSLLPCIALHAINNTIALANSQQGWGVAEVAGCLGGSGLILACIVTPLVRSRRLNTPPPQPPAVPPGPPQPATVA